MPMPLIASIRFSAVDSKHSVLFPQDFSCNNSSDNKISQNNYIPHLKGQAFISLGPMFPSTNVPEIPARQSCWQEKHHIPHLKDQTFISLGPLMSQKYLNENSLSHLAGLQQIRKYLVHLTWHLQWQAKQSSYREMPQNTSFERSNLHILRFYVSFH